MFSSPAWAQECQTYALDAGQEWAVPCEGYFVPEPKLREFITAEKILLASEKKANLAEERAEKAEDRVDKLEKKLNRKRGFWNTAGKMAVGGLVVTIILLL